MQTRRQAILGLGAVGLSACGTSGSLNSGASIDESVNQAQQQMYRVLPYTRDIAQRAAGVLIMPGIVKAGVIVGGAYGEGALRTAADGFQRTVQYYSFGSASVGYQLGLQKTKHALFFMTPAALTKFQASQGFEVGADAEVTLIDTGFKADLNTTELQQPILAVVFSQQGLLAGASLEGAKYTRLVP